MKHILFIASLVASGTAFAQEFAPPDKELWDLLARELGNINMTLPAHQQVQQLLQNVQREAQMRAARAKLPKPADKKE